MQSKDLTTQSRDLTTRSRDLTTEKRVQFDFEVEFSNGGGLQGQGFRLDIDGDDIDDQALADAIVADLRLLMVGAVRILNKRIIAEPHKRARAGADAEPRRPSRRRSRDLTTQSRDLTTRLVDLSHAVEDGMVTYRGLPPPRISDYLSREASRGHYAPGTEFHIGRIDMVANTGTYVDSPSHRFADGADLAALDLASLADLPGVVVRATGMAGRSVGRSMVAAALADVDPRGAAVLVETGWGDRHWRTERYFEGHPFLAADAAEHLASAGAALVGIDSCNIDDTADPTRPAHTTLLRAGIPIVEHLRGLGELPLAGFRFSAVPVKVRGMGTFPVRAHAVVEAGR
jgi:kynurenine formamidase